MTPPVSHNLSHQNIEAAEFAPHRNRQSLTFLAHLRRFCGLLWRNNVSLDVPKLPAKGFASSGE
jgi:hypothetical protein